MDKENKVLVTVAGRDITEKDIDIIISRYPEEQRAMFQSEEARAAILEQVIGFELVYNYGKDQKVDETEEYKFQIEQLKKEILIQTTFSNIIDKVTVSDEDTKKYYEENQEEFEEPEMVSAKHILLKDSKKAAELKEKIVSGELTFEEAAKGNSFCPSKEQGGNLGEFSRGMMVPEFEKVAFEIAIGEVSDPVETQFGYHLIKVESKKDASTKAFEEVKEQIASKLLTMAQQSEYAKLLKELEAKYQVVRNVK
ncbi:peptidylprolyl isomerase [Clostridium sp.]|uniref:peptidylprolyl isomerase n=1 Tax=Clostridium sp. TaxID=1506 RepID=UPI0039942435